MLFPEAESPLVRAWITKRIANTSDADADVLAEYLIALLSHDGDRAAVRSLCEAEIPDFLSEDTGKFLDDVFQAIDTKAYLPDNQRPQLPLPAAAPVGDASRKRRVSDHEIDRPTKQSRRGARRGRGQGAGRGQDPVNDAWAAAMGDFAGSSNPMEVMMHLNAMGMPMPWMQMAPPPRKRGRCRDYDRKGFCSRGTACPYDHSERKKSNRRKAPFSADGPVSDPSKTTIVVENIPEDSLEEPKVREFFTQFGEIVELSLRPEMRLATIKYADWASADAAYKSPKAIFDNRFVKVFWHKGKQEEKAEPEIDLDEFQRRQDEMQKQYQDKAGKRSELEKQRQELEAQQAALLEKHQAETERLRAKLAERNGGETTADLLREKLAALEQEAKILGIDTEAPRGGYRGRGTGRGRGRGLARGGRHAAYAQFSLDNRPKTVAVSGVDFTDAARDEALRHYLLNIGEFESVEPGAETTTVAFKDRKTAESFFFSLDGKELPDVQGTLSMAWATAAKGDDAMSEGEVADDGRAVDMDYEGAWN